MKLARKAGSTSNIFQVFIQDSSSTTGAGLTALTNASGSLTAYYHRDTDTTATAIILVTMTVGTFTASGFKEIDATNMPGWYQFCPPDAALASGAKSVGFHLKGASNMAPLPIEVDLDAQVDVTHWNGTAVSAPATAGIPEVNVKNINNQAAATPGASGGLLISGTNAGTTTLGALTITGATTLTGAVALQSTLVVTGTTTFAAVALTSFAASGAFAVNSFTINSITLPNAVLAGVTEGSITLKQAVNVMLAALAGKSNGSLTTTENFRDQADTKNRIAATIDASGNRTVVTIDGS